MTDDPRLEKLMLIIGPPRLGGLNASAVLASIDIADRAAGYRRFCRDDPDFREQLAQALYVAGYTNLPWRDDDELLNKLYRGRAGAIISTLWGEST